jgi:biotin carboxylase
MSYRQAEKSCHIGNSRIIAIRFLLSKENDLKKNLLLLCGYERDMRELRHLSLDEQYIIFSEPSSKEWLSYLCNAQSCKEVPERFERSLQILIDYCQHNSIDGVISTCDYPANVMRAALNNELGFAGCPIETILVLEHKYYARLLQQAFVPEAVPAFSLLLPDSVQMHKRPFPFFIKPIKSSFSNYAFVIENEEDFDQKIHKCIQPPTFIELFNFLIKRYTNLVVDARYLLAEDLLCGMQTTVEGYVYNKQVIILGVVDSIMYPGTICFQRFEYPSLLPQEVQQRMESIAQRFIEQLPFDNSLFNIEFMYNPCTNELHIIEVNPRISSQFADLFERVIGVNTYQILVDLSLGRNPQAKPVKGSFGVAASFVLRVFENYFVQAVPSQDDIKKAQELFPDLRVEIHARKGHFLSDEKQDGKSFRYCLIQLGGEDRKDLIDRFSRCVKLLPFSFSSLH